MPDLPGLSRPIGIHLFPVIFCNSTKYALRHIDTRGSAAIIVSNGDAVRRGGRSAPFIPLIILSPPKEGCGRCGEPASCDVGEINLIDHPFMQFDSVA